MKEGPRYTKLSIIVAILPANDFNLNPWHNFHLELDFLSLLSTFFENQRRNGKNNGMENWPGDSWQWPDSSAMLLKVNK